MSFLRSFALLPLLLANCVAAPSGTVDSNWDTDSVLDERNSTHLFVVQNAILILAREDESAAARQLLNALEEPECAQQWKLGLHEADYRAIYNGGKSDITVDSTIFDLARERPTWETHFYNPETGLNYRGNTRTSLSETMKELASIKKILGPRAERFDACYSLGLALHYFTDITQPMHAANFTSLSHPLYLHSNLEARATELQSSFIATRWSERPSASVGDAFVSDFFIQTARDSKAQFVVTHASILDAYDRSHESYEAKCATRDRLPLFDVRACWKGDSAVDANIGDSIMFAQDRTAQFLSVLAVQVQSK
jgi:phospholipase C